MSRRTARDVERLASEREGTSSMWLNRFVLAGLALAVPLGALADEPAVEGAAAREAAHLAGQLKKHPAKPPASDEWVGLHLLDVQTGEVALVGGEPGPGMVYLGSPEWSYDGRRIVFDATPAPGN